MSALGIRTRRLHVDWVIVRCRSRANLSRRRTQQLTPKTSLVLYLPVEFHQLLTQCKEMRWQQVSVRWWLERRRQARPSQMRPQVESLGGRAIGGRARTGGAVSARTSHWRDLVTFSLFRWLLVSLGAFVKATDDVAGIVTTTLRRLADQIQSLIFVSGLFVRFLIVRLRPVEPSAGRILAVVQPQIRRDEQLVRRWRRSCSRYGKSAQRGRLSAKQLHLVLVETLGAAELHLTIAVVEVDVGHRVAHVLAEVAHFSALEGGPTAHREARIRTKGSTANQVRI